MQPAKDTGARTTGKAGVGLQRSFSVSHHQGRVAEQRPGCDDIMGLIGRQRLFGFGQRPSQTHTRIGQ